MYAIIQTGGKQYKVQPGDVLRVEKLDANPGSEIELTDVLVVGGEKIYIGQPMVKNAKVTVVVTRQHKAPKVIVFKKKRRQGYRRLGGHRQLFTEIFVKTIASPEGQVAKAEGQPNVYDQEKKQARDQKKAEYWTQAKRAVEKKEDGVVETKKASAGKKTVAKKTAKKKTASKSAAKGGKKKTTTTKKKA